jgi:hypothetical protein
MLAVPFGAVAVGLPFAVVTATWNRSVVRRSGQSAPGQAADKRRNQVERGFNRRKHWPGLADWLRTVPDGLDLRDRT